MKRIVTLMALMYWCIAAIAQQPYPTAPPAPANIVRLEYVTDANIPYGSGTSISVTPGTNLANVNVALDLAGVPAGVRTLYIRSQDATGKWSITNLQTFFYGSIPAYPTASASANIVRLEYVLDANIPYGSGTPILVTPGTNLSNLNVPLDLTGVPPGIRTLYIRSQDATGKWSITNLTTFSNGNAPAYPVASALQNIVQLEYVLDANIPYGSGTSIPVTPGTNISNLNASIDLSSLPLGPHTLYLRSKDASGKWSITNVQSFSNGSAPNYPADRKSVV